MTKMPNLENSRWRTVAILKMVLSLYLSRESSDFNEIWCADANFVSINGHMIESIEILQIQNGGRPPYWKSFLGYISTIFVRLTRKLVWRSRISLRHRSHGQNNRPSFCLWVTVSDYMSAYRSGGCSELIGDVFQCWQLYKDISAISTQ